MTTEWTLIGFIVAGLVSILSLLCYSYIVYRNVNKESRERKQQSTNTK